MGKYGHNDKLHIVFDTSMDWHRSGLTTSFCRVVSGARPTCGFRVLIYALASRHGLALIHEAASAGRFALCMYLAFLKSNWWEF